MRCSEYFNNIAKSALQRLRFLSSETLHLKMYALTDERIRRSGQAFSTGKKLGITDCGSIATSQQSSINKPRSISPDIAVGAGAVADEFHICAERMGGRWRTLIEHGAAALVRTVSVKDNRVQ